MKIGDIVIYSPKHISALSKKWSARVGQTAKIIDFPDPCRVTIVFEGEHESFKILSDRLKLKRKRCGHHLTNIFK